MRVVLNWPVHASWISSAIWADVRPTARPLALTRRAISVSLCCLPDIPAPLTHVSTGPQLVTQRSPQVAVRLPMTMK
ncbi:hypothetical protein GCM10022224_000630 [Nonomuraea antimicrobica]|uniref:Secreted protein n=1 Tax=Nonomuraea antimicrobica TaxID=561173 RepID=A0ABP7AW90_9ACTN